ncbi:RICIN domain-containing protein [Dactylosporangium sp. AC04546]|uniref:RICIN domain-containing protein n=1 Tax=Dactylosporangium sp. AC04546 TaxID=2862460 RepID=UPI001EDDA7A9|nr:RICIN domain-containing protein [Dactylosporangium sp. AC04546]WVK87617.1 RICIN domain-containing protein [Dactylosporangium sp. AC04546]
MNVRRFVAGLSIVLLAVLGGAQPASADITYLHARNNKENRCIQENGPNSSPTIEPCNIEWNQVFQFEIYAWLNGSAVYLIKSRNGNCLDALVINSVYVQGSGSCNGGTSQQWIGITQPNGTLVFVNNYWSRCMETAYVNALYMDACSTWINGVPGTADQQFAIY